MSDTRAAWDEAGRTADLRMALLLDGATPAPVQAQPTPPPPAASLGVAAARTVEEPASGPGVASSLVTAAAAGVAAFLRSGGRRPADAPPVQAPPDPAAWEPPTEPRRSPWPLVLAVAAVALVLAAVAGRKD
jgi:hypothetical protein